jgi:hypothetical protein
MWILIIIIATIGNSGSSQMRVEFETPAACVIARDTVLKAEVPHLKVVACVPKGTK